MPSGTEMPTCAGSAATPSTGPLWPQNSPQMMRALVPYAVFGGDHRVAHAFRCHLSAGKATEFVNGTTVCALTLHLDSVHDAHYHQPISAEGDGPAIIFSAGQRQQLGLLPACEDRGLD